ncbi:TRAP transporter small permease [Rhodoligotrophos ferricapiens]|uniref:TRAP transporter small permease n=1 Tax=Rhodoligotrophos ferricapiens TaxID=3069264 RepID=UPI00315C9473
MTDLAVPTGVRPLLKVLDRLGDAGGALATIVMWLLAITVTYDVILRTLGIPTLWPAEVSIYLMIALAFFGVGATQGVDGHFRVTFLRDLCPPKVRAALDIFALLLSLAFAIGFTIGAWKLASFSAMLNFKTSTILQVPMWILQGLMVIGGVLLSLATLRDLLLVFVHGSALRDKSGASEVI